MSVTIVEVSNPKKSAITIRPYVDENSQNMGLEKYNLVLHDGTSQVEQLACIEINGIKRYLTGLYEFAPEVKNIPDKEYREARIKDIRETVSELEKELGANMVDPTDPDFWNKIKLLAPTNSELWDKIIIKCGNDPVHLDPLDPYDRIKLSAIEVGGFSLIAKSFEDAKSRSVPPKFYLDKQNFTVATKTESKKLRNKALSELEKLFNKNMTKLMYVAKVVDINSVQYKKNTPNDIIYDNMDRFINGEGIEKNKQRAATTFLDTCNLDMEVLKIRSLIKDSTYYKFITPKPDGFIYHTESSSLMGRNPSELVDFLKNPLNEQILMDLSKKVEKLWNQ